MEHDVQDPAPAARLLVDLDPLPTTDDAMRLHQTFITFHFSQQPGLSNAGHPGPVGRGPEHVLATTMEGLKRMATGRRDLGGAAERAAKIAAVKEEQRRRERRTRLVLIAAVSLVVVGLSAAVAITVAGEVARRADLEAAASAPISGVEEFEDLSAAHVESTPEPVPAGAALLPPVGGDHDPVWQNCGIYTEPVGTPNAVHSLEHGAVWLTYRPDLPQDQVDTLTDLVEGEPYALLSPFEALAAPVVLTAWGVQLELDRADDPRAAVFLAKYLQGEQTPEPGAACSGGIGDGGA